MKNYIRVLSLLLALVLTLSLCACNQTTDDSTSSDIIIETEQTVTEVQDDIESNNQVTSDNSSQNQTTTTPSNTSSDNSSVPSNTQSVNPNASATPQVTICARVAKDTYIVGGVCSKTTEYISVGGTNVTATKIIPTVGKDNNYFIGQVKVNSITVMEIQAKETGKDLSEKIKKSVSYSSSQKDLMTYSDYQPVFGLNSRGHYYSAILTYTMSNFLTSYEKEYANNNIKETVNAANSVGAEVIYLVVPSSAAVYPETVPSEYKAASGETLYSAFKTIAENSGAKVIYPLDTMKAHKNDGEGYKIYSNTDSHWTTYGAYFGVSELMNYISSKYPSAKPRTVAEMGFYTTELYGGDMLFSFGDDQGFENYSKASFNDGKTEITGIKELTTLYSLKMPTNTLSTITRNKKSVYLTKSNEGASSFTNQNGSGLPSAVIVRDSFARTAYDMVNDRFSKITWLAEGDYTSVIDATYQQNPNYVIYIVSERNLLKVMLNNKDIVLRNYA